MKKVFGALIASAILSAVVIGCGPKDEGATDTAAPAKPAATTGTTAGAPATTAGAPATTAAAPATTGK